MKNILLYALIVIAVVLAMPTANATRTSGYSITTIQTGHWETIIDRVWIPARTEWTFIPAVYQGGRMITPGRREPRTVPGHWETYCHQIWVQDRW